MSTKTDTSGISEQLKRDIENAKAVAKSRMSAPVIAVSDRQTQQKELIERFAPECVGKGGRKPQWHPFTDEPARYSLRISQGYEPVVDPTTKRQVVSESGDLLFRLPMKLHQRNLKEVSDRSARILRTGNNETGPREDGIDEKISVITADAEDLVKAAEEVGAATE